jgi:hypothetical protein
MDLGGAALLKSHGRDFDHRICEDIRSFLRKVMADTLDDVMHPLAAKFGGGRCSARRGDYAV